MKKEILGIIDGNLLMSKVRVIMDNKTVAFKNKKKETERRKCRKKIKHFDD